MKLILVGPDGSGKSTLAKRLQEATGYRLVKMDKPVDNSDMFEMYKNILDTKDNLILDRSWHCEMVYGPIMRDYSQIALPDMLILEKIVLNNGGGIIIYCTGHLTKLWARCKSRGEDYIRDIDTLATILDRYETLFDPKVHEHLIPVVRYVINENVF